MKLQIRNSQDPFTQALAFILRTSDKKVEVKEKMRVSMITLVTQVAVKIGAIDTEQSVRDRALPVFTGIISLHLVNSVHGRECNVIEEWVKEVTEHDLAILFRKGYTLVDGLIKNASATIWDNSLSRARTFAERIQELSTYTTNGVWAGYELYRKKLTFSADEKAVSELAIWLFEAAGTPVHRLQHGLDIDTEGPEVKITRVLFNVLHSGRISSDLNFKKVRDIVDAARTNQRWWLRAQRYYSSFIENLPEKFRQCLEREDSEVTKNIVSVLAMAKSLTDKRRTRYQNIDHICLMTGLNPPGLTKEARKMFR